MTTWELTFLEVAPPGREPQVRALKGKVANPYAVAWASYNGEEAELTAKKRKGLKKSSFAVPGKRAYPIHDISHARNALARASGKSVEPQVKAAVYKKFPSLKPGAECEANSSGGLPQTLRGETESAKILHAMLRESVAGASYRFCEAAQITQANQTPEGPMVTAVLITEGLGNRADMHYYGQDCIRSGAALFEGKPCFIDHQAKSEAQERPERTVRDKCGYFKNVRAEAVDGRLGLVAELHFDLSETGKFAYDKACTAIHYKQEFPSSGEEYVGLSIAADGKLEERTMQVGDEILDVKYVTEFTAVGSVDEVTSPARGGRFVAVR